MKFPKTLIFLAFAILLLPIFAFAQTPGIPHKFYGTVSFTSGSTPDGLLVEAKINGVVFGSSSTKEEKYGYLPDLFFVTDPQSSNNGKTINFYVSGIDTGKTAVFENGASTLLNLTVSGSVGTIEKSETQKIENETIAVAPNNPVNIKMGDNKLNVTVSSNLSTNANITKVEKLEISFFTGSAAIIAGNNLLNAFEIDITGDNLTISVTMTYDETGIDEDTVKPYKFNGTSWVAISSFTLNKSANTVTFNISSAGTPYVVFGQLPAPSGGGGGGGITTPTPTPSPLSLEAQKVDSNKDNKIDILDFNTLMVNWGSTLSGNIADFNGDGKVDIFDFNLLMIYWTG